MNKSVIRTGKNWLKGIGTKAFYSPELKEGTYYRLKEQSHSKDYEVEIYAFEEVVIID